MTFVKTLPLPAQKRLKTPVTSFDANPETDLVAGEIVHRISGRVPSNNGREEFRRSLIRPSHPATTFDRSFSNHPTRATWRPLFFTMCQTKSFMSARTECKDPMQCCFQGKQNKRNVKFMPLNQLC
jgi:hypothetical protein